MASRDQGRLFEDPTLYSDMGDENDFYETPAWAVELVLPMLPQEPCALLEPAAGRGAILDVLLPCPYVQAAWAVELDPTRHQELARKHPGVSIHRGDFFWMHHVHQAFQAHPARKLAPLNPPYTKPRETIGLEFVEKCIELCQPAGFVAALLPLAFCTGVERSERIHDRYPCSVYPFRRRPHFGGDGSGSRDFAWFTFDLLNPKREWRVIG